MTAGDRNPLRPVPGRPVVWFGNAFYHLVALLVFVPYFFSWTGVTVAAVGAILSALGINVGYHRLLAHKGFSCSKRVEHCLALLGVLAHQFGPAYWVAIHRRHHQSSDQPEDPHSPRRSFFWSHIGWLLAASENTDQDILLERYAKDLMRDPLYAWLEANANWGSIVVLAWPLLFVVGAAAVKIGGGTTEEAVRMGASLVVWHVTFSVNSICHYWGYRNYETPDRSRNNPIVGLLAFGEGWHNNHHASPRSPRHGHRWWEIDLAWLVIKAMAAMGLVTLANADEPKPL